MIWKQFRKPMVNPFAEIDWNPDRKAVRAFGRNVLIFSSVVVPIAFGLHVLLAARVAGGFFLFLSTLFAVFFALGLIAFLLPAAGKHIYKVWYFLSACIGLVVTNLLLLLFFFGFFTPIAWVMRYVLCRDPLLLERPRGTMWRAHEPPRCVSRYYRQF